MSRECNNCTKCCEGWLSANINGHPMYPGKPCFFVEIGKGCKIYEDRPEDPCKGFLCSWIQIEEMPDHFKPDDSGVIMHKKHARGIDFYSISKAPNSPTVEYLTWAINFVVSRGENLVWNYDDKVSWLGSKEFSEMMAESHKECSGCGNFHWKWNIDSIDPEILKLTLR